MPTFEVEAAGKSYEIEAPDLNAATAALGKFTQPPSANIGENRAGAISALSGIPVLGAYAPQAAAALNAATQPIGLPANASEAPTYGERYAENLAKFKQGAQQFGTEHPLAAMGGQLTTGAAALGPLGTTALGARALGMVGTLPARIGQGMAGGAAIASADALARGEDIAPATGLGALVGGGAPVIGRGLGAAYQGARNILAPEPRTFGNFANVAGERVPLTGAQASGDQAASMLEQTALRGGMGERAQQITKGAFGEQQAALGRANEAIGRELGGSPGGASPFEAAESTSEAIKAAAARSKANYQGLYKDFANKPGEFAPETFDSLSDKIKQGLADRPAPIIFDASSVHTTPNAVRALQFLDKQFSTPAPEAAGVPSWLNIQKASPELLASIGVKPTPPITTDKIDRTGKALVTFLQDAKTNPADSRATNAVIKEFGNRIDNAMDAGLFSGSDDAIQTWKDARAAFRQHKEIFSSRGSGDEVGRVMEKITGKFDGQAATPTQVANYLYGDANIGGNSIAPKLATRLQGILSPEEMGAVKQGLWARLTQTAEGRSEMGHQRIAERIFEFLNGKGKQLADVILTQQERDLMQTFASALKQMVPPAGSVNFSNTAPVLARIAKGAASHLLALFGAGVGGLPGAIIGHGADVARKYLAEGAAAKNVARSLFNDPTTALIDKYRRETLARLAALAAPRTSQSR